MLEIMKSRLKLIFLIFSSLLYVGCVTNTATGYYANGEIVTGTVNQNIIFGGGGRFTVSNETGKVCEGSADGPDEVDYTKLGCSGQSVLGRGSCSDGTDFSFRWNAMSNCRVAIASGMDNTGNRICMVMGENTQKVTDLIRSGSIDDDGYCRDILMETASIEVENENAYLCRTLGKREVVLKLTKDSDDTGSVMFGDEKVSAIYSTEGLDVRWDWGGEDYNNYAVIVGIDGIAKYYSWVGVEKTWINPTGSAKPTSLFECDKT